MNKNVYLMSEEKECFRNRDTWPKFENHRIYICFTRKGEDIESEQEYLVISSNMTNVIDKLIYAIPNLQVDDIYAIELFEEKRI